MYGIHPYTSFLLTVKAPVRPIPLTACSALPMRLTAFGFSRQLQGELRLCLSAGFSLSPAHFYRPQHRLLFLFKAFLQLNLFYTTQLKEKCQDIGFVKRDKITVDFEEHMI